MEPKLENHYKSLTEEQQNRVKVRALQLKYDIQKDEFKKKSIPVKLWIVARGYAAHWYAYYFDQEKYLMEQKLKELIIRGV
jgi:hypothetical protein